MKKSVFTLMLGAIVGLASCSQSDEVMTGVQEGGQIATFTVQVPAVTRAAVDGTKLTRYIVEAYENKDLGNGVTPQRVESSNGTLQLTLKKNTDYTFLFWADGGTAKTETTPGSGYWETKKLRAVEANVNKKNEQSVPAYSLSKSFNSKDLAANATITLKNATAQVNFVEGAGLVKAGNTLKVTYSEEPVVNVGTGEVIGMRFNTVHTFTVSGNVAKDAVIATDYILASQNEQYVVNLKVQLNDEAEKTINNVPFQQSYKTNIKGEYSNLYASTFTVSNEVEDYTNNEDKEFIFAKVGDYYYSDKTYSTLYNGEKTCIGIVYEVNADGTSGKIVGLDEPVANWNGGGNEEGKLKWSSEKIVTGATDTGNGLKNMEKIAAINEWVSKYPAFAWVHSKNAENTVYTENATGIWYLPAENELLVLCRVKTTVNKALVGASKSTLRDSYYYLSSENGDAMACNFNFFDKSAGVTAKTNPNNNYVRAIYAF